MHGSFLKMARKQSLRKNILLMIKTLVKITLKKIYKQSGLSAHTFVI